MQSFPHIRIAEKSWNNSAVLSILDALVTYHGTAGIEFAGLGKPVLVPDKGKYDDCRFVLASRDRLEYLNHLRTNWWSKLDLQSCQSRAEIFAGWWFCAPDWQKNFLLPDDSLQNSLYDLIPDLLSSCDDEVNREIAHLKNWLSSGHPYSHTYKMKYEDSFRLTTTDL